MHITSSALFALCLLTFAQAGIAHAADAPPSKPNILLIVSDDQGYADIPQHRIRLEVEAEKAETRRGHGLNPNPAVQTAKHAKHANGKGV